MAPYFEQAVHALRDLPCVVDIRNIGMMAAIEISPAGQNPGVRGHEVQKALYDANLNLKSTGDSLILAPPFIAEKAHIDRITDTVRKVLTKF